MPNARTTLEPTTSMTTEPTMARMICVCTTAGVRVGVPRRRGRNARRAPNVAASGMRQLACNAVSHCDSTDSSGGVTPVGNCIPTASATLIGARTATEPSATVRQGIACMSLDMLWSLRDRPQYTRDAGMVLLLLVTARVNQSRRKHGAERGRDHLGGIV